MGDVGERLARLPERGECGPVVERRDGGSRLDRAEDPVVDDRRLDHEAAEVDDPVPDRVGGRELVDRRRPHRRRRARASGWSSRR